MVQFADLKYLGAFRVPATFANGDEFSLGGRPVAYNPARNSLYVGSRLGRVAEINIPTPVNSTNVAALPFASYLQGFYDPTDGNLWRLASSGASIDSIMVYGNRLFGTGSIYYDANNTQRVSHYSRSLQLNQASFSGWSQVWEPEKSGFVSGLMAVVPAEWQAKLGGPVISGNCCIPIAWRTSWGPAAFAYDPTQIGQPTVAAHPLLFYNGEHATLGHWSAASTTYGATTQVNGVAVIAGTRTILYFGRNGLGPYCYGNGTTNQSLHGTVGVDGATWCYDPTTADKGSHAYPYRYQIWAYDLNELAAVKAGLKQPWQVVPYGVWPFELPITEASVKVGGVGYDAERQIIYLSQMRADEDGYGHRPLIHALKVGGVAGSPLPSPELDDPAPAPAPAPSTSTKVTAVSSTPSKASPQPAGTTIVWTAVPTGGIAPHEYKWWTYDGSKWIAMTGWGTSNTWAWTPQAANSNYRVTVWVRSAGKTNDVEEWKAEVKFPIGAATSAPAPDPAPSPSTSAKVTAVGMGANKVAPQPASTTVTFTAMPSGGTAPLQYKWWVYDGSKWTVSVNWSTSSTFNWTPTSANAGYKVTAWVRSAGNTADAEEAKGEMSFPISTGGSTSSPSSKVTSVAIGANKAAPQPPSTTITFSAVPTGGAAPHQYKWWVYDGSKWNVMVNWSTSSTFNWTPATAHSGYKVTAWVRSAGSSTDAEEAKGEMSFPISSTATSGDSPTTSGPLPESSAKVSLVSMVASKAAPQAPGTTITFTAAPMGGVAPHQYKWWIYNGSTWTAQGTWTTANTFSWTPTAANAKYKITAWVRSAGKTTDVEEAKAEMPFEISSTTSANTGTPTGSGLTTAVSLTANKTAPQLVNTAITWTATPTGGVGPHEYKFYVWNSSSWVVARGWSTTNTFTWVPNMANPYYKVAVWVRSAGNTSDAYEASFMSPIFPIK